MQISILMHYRGVGILNHWYRTVYCKMKLENVAQSATNVNQSKGCVLTHGLNVIIALENSTRSRCTGTGISEVTIF